MRIRPLLVFLSLSLLMPGTLIADSNQKENSVQDQTKETYLNPSVIQIGSLPPVDVGLAVNGDKEFVRLDEVAEKLQETGQVMEGNKPIAFEDKRDERLNAGNREVLEQKAIPSDVAAEKGNHTCVGLGLQTSF